MNEVLNNTTVNTLRILSVEATNKAKSGHPGMPLGAAPMVLALWGECMRHNPKHPTWHARDRFVLSAGHGSALLYSLMHVFGYGITRDDLMAFRQNHSKTPGHPEFKHTPGVEITTGPLGQGIANAVGFAMAESHLAARFNKPDARLIDNYTYAICGDGCLQEGISAEAASLAGTLKLGKLILLYDSNDITIEGPTEISFTEDVGKRFEAYGWHVQYVADGNDMEAIVAAVQCAKQETSRPSIIEIKTVIGYGAKNAGTAAVHGSPLGDAGLAHLKDALGWQHTEEFYVPDEVCAAVAAWQAKMQVHVDERAAADAAYAAKHPECYAKWQSQLDGEPMYSLDIDTFVSSIEYPTTQATRASGEVALNKIAGLVPNLFGGSADLSPSTLSIMKGLGDYSASTPGGQNIHFGVREHAMAAIANGISAYGGIIPYVAGFFVFSDYMKPAMRLAALMGLRVIYIMTHDSIGVGEDGPTHQPVEQLAMLRSIPGFCVLRPCDARETAAAWAWAIENPGPTAIVLTRQNLPTLEGTGSKLANGAYILRDSINPKTNLPDVLLMASGSEVHLCVQAQEILHKQGIHARVISMPSMELFDMLEPAEQDAIMPKAVRVRLAVEAASPFGWHKYTGLDGDIISVSTFGASAPADELFAACGLCADNIAKKAAALIACRKD